MTYIIIIFGLMTLLSGVIILANPEIIFKPLQLVTLFGFLKGINKALSKPASLEQLIERLIISRCSFEKVVAK